MKMKQLLQAFLLSLSIWLSGCYTVPQTGRSALNLYPDEQLASMSALQFDKLKQETPISRDPEYNAMMQRVGKRIAYVAREDIPDVQWEFVVFDDDSQINAFAMPGGKVAAYTGIFKVARTEEELAVVIGHEIAHVTAKHGNERLSQQSVLAGGALALQIGISEWSQSNRELLLAAFGAGATFGVILPYSRHHESEADEIGLIYAAKAGYDPRAAITFWQRMEAEKNQSVPEFLSTHPTGETRIKRLNEMMPKAFRLYEQSSILDAEF